MKETRDFIIDFIHQIDKLDRKEKYDYIILANPKTFCLIHGMKEAERKRFFKKTYSFEKIDIISTDFNGKKVLIADLIMDKGIHTARVYESINKYNPLAIDTTIGLVTVELPKYYAHYGAYTYIYSKIDVHYREVLTRVNEFIYFINQPYISNTYAFEITEGEYMKFKENSKVEQKDYEKIFAIDYISTDKVKYFNCKDIKHNFISTAFIRVYPSKDFHKVIVIPYIELKPLTAGQIKKVWKKLNIPIQFNTVVDKYKAIKAILSFALYKKYFAYSYNEMKWIDSSFCENFIEIVEERINFSTLFNEVEEAIGDIVVTTADNKNISIMQENLKNFQWNDLSKDLKLFVYTSYNSIQGYLNSIRKSSNGYNIPDCEYATKKLVDLSQINPLPIHELLEMIPSDKLKDFYANLLYLFDADCIMPCVYFKDGVVQTFLDIFYG